MTIVCEQCRQPFETSHRRQRFCSRRCAAKARPPGFFAAMGRKGGASLAQKCQPDLMRQRLRERVQTLFAGLTPWEAFKAGALWMARRKRQPDHQAYQRGRRAGFADGYEQALTDMRRGVA